MQRDCLALASGQVNTVERSQSAHWELDPGRNLPGLAQVDLRDFVAIHVAGVLDVDIDVETAVRGFFDLQSRVFECGETEAMAKGEKRGYILFVKPAVAHRSEEHTSELQ